MKTKPKVYIMASGTKDGGGSGFKNLVQACRRKIHPLNYEIAGVICNILGGGVEEKAKKLDVPFFYFEGVVDEGTVRRWDAKHCYELIGEEEPFVMMSGWLKVGAGYIPKKTINIHPGPTWVNTQGGQSFAGAGMYGHYVHEAILSAYVRGDISHTEVTIHAVTDLPDGGAPIARIPVLLCPDDTAETIAQRVNKEEHAWQPLVMEAWLNGKIQVSEDGLHVIYSPFPH